MCAGGGSGAGARRWGNLLAAPPLLVDGGALERVWPVFARALLAKGVQLRCDEAAKAALKGVLEEEPKFGSFVQDAKDEDFDTEFLDLILAVKTVPAVDGDEMKAIDFAIAHVNAHSSHHTDAILTSSRAKADAFLAGVDSAGVYWNTSTRMADGMRYGFGTEVGISTGKTHARGPVGLDGLVIYKYLAKSHGQKTGAQTAAQFNASNPRLWAHQDLPATYPEF